MAKFKPDYQPDTSIYYYDSAIVDKCKSFIDKYLVYPAPSVGCNTGEPLKLTPWQVDYISYIFGWRRKDDHSRMVRETCLFVAKKNGKTTLSAVIALLLLLVDTEGGENIISIAPSRQQADLCFNYAKSMIVESPTLSTLVKQKKIRIYKDRIVIPSTGSQYSVRSGSAQSIHGPSISSCLFDEIHALRGRNLYDAVKGSGKARKSPLKVYTSTAGWDRSSLCYELWTYAKQIIEGSIVNPTFYPLIFEPDEHDDWKAEATWFKANPNWHLINRIEWDTEFSQALAMPAAENSFKQLSLNMWTSQSSRWMPYEVWSGCHTGETMAAAAERTRGWTAVGGLDIAPVWDTSSLVLLAEPPDKSEKPVVLCWVWIPEQTAAEREQRDRVPYSLWERQGYVRYTPGGTTDYDTLYSDILSILKKYNVQEIGFDAAYVGMIAQWLERDGFAAVQISQSYESMSPAIGELERIIRAKEIAVPTQPCLDWMISNASVKRNNGGQTILNKSSKNTRIDAVAALAMTIKRKMVKGDVIQKKESIYESESILVI